MEWSSKHRPPSRAEKLLAGVIFILAMLVAATIDSWTVWLK